MVPGDAQGGGAGSIALSPPRLLSLDGPAHQFHRAVMAELTGATTSGSATPILAAQRAYAQTGLMPELLTVYQLLGDPAMKNTPMKKSVRPRRTVRCSWALSLVAPRNAAPTEARTTVASRVTNGSGVSQNPFDKASQRKVVRDSSGACYVVFTQTRCYGAGEPPGGPRPTRTARS